MLIAAIIGFCFGFFGSIPIAGPIAALVLQRGITGRFRAGALIGLGAAVAEAGYAFLAFWGFATFLVRYPIIEPISRLAAALILIGLGVSFTRYSVAGKAKKENEEDEEGTEKTEKEEKPKRKGVLSDLRHAGLGFTITALNPTLIATWTAATTTLYSADIVELAPSSAPAFALGTLLGIGGWFTILTWLLHRYHGRFSQGTLERVVRGVGFLILGLGLFFGYRFVAYVIAR